MVIKATLVERRGRARPQAAAAVDVKDLSTDDVRIAPAEEDADEKMVMAHLFKHTPLQTSFVVNLTCLVPTEGNPKSDAPSLPLPAGV